VGSAAAILFPSGIAAQIPCDSARVRRLPVIERPATDDTATTLVVLLTGDGGWAGADEKVATGLRARGAAVVGLNMRSYLGDRKTPEQAADDVGCIAEYFSALWRRSRLLLLGYSRGADIAPFVAARWPDTLRARLNMIALVSPSTRANFKFHFIDLLRDVERDDDLPIGPELLRLRGLRVICIYGTGDKGSGCPGNDPQLVQSYARPGGHRLTGGFDAVADLLAAGLSPPPE
jgi:type IV secretory pathway VirJ component